MAKEPKGDGRKKINYEILEREKNPDPYALMDSLIGQYHPHLAEARIALAWRFGFKPDADERLVLGRCRKCSDLEREAHGWDFIIILNHEFWNHAETTAAHRAALMDHELCHASVSKDQEGEPREDVRGRNVYRIRKHDVEEFREIVDRHGIWKQDLQKFAESLAAAARAPLFKHPGVTLPENPDDAFKVLRTAALLDQRAEEARLVLGKLYKETIEPIRKAIRGYMERHGYDAVKAALHVNGDLIAQGDQLAPQYLAAAVKDVLMEETPTTDKKPRTKAKAELAKAAG